MQDIKKDSISRFTDGRKSDKSASGGLFLDKLSPDKDLSSADSCLEFLILSFCQCFDLKPKQAAGLLTESSKYLAHVVVKGIKSNHEPVLAWASLIQLNIHRLCQLVLQEQAQGSLTMILSAFKPGLCSKSLTVCKACSDILTQIKFYVTADLQEVFYDWFLKEGLEACMAGYKKHDTAYCPVVSKLIQNFLNSKSEELLAVSIKKYIEDDISYIHFLGELFEEMITEVPVDSIAPIILNIALRQADIDNSKQANLRLAALNLLYRIWVIIPDYINSQLSLSSSLLSMFKRACRDKSLLFKTASIGYLFQLLHSFYNSRTSYAPILYKTLVFLLIENTVHEDIREFISYNFITLLEQIDTLPINILVDSIAKQFRMANDVRMNVFDFEMYVSIARHDRMNEESAVQMMDMLGNIYLSELEFKKAVLAPFMNIASRFLESEAVQEFLVKYVKYSLRLITSHEKQAKGNQKQKNAKPMKLGKLGSNELVETDASIYQRRNNILDFISKIISLKQDDLNLKVKNSLLENNWEIKLKIGKDYKGFVVLLDTFGNSSDIIAEFEANFRPIMLRNANSMIVSQGNMLSPVSYKPPPATGRAALMLEKTKQKRNFIQAKAREIKSSQDEQLRKQKKFLSYEIQKRVVMHGIKDTILLPVSAGGEVDHDLVIDLNNEPSEEQDYILKLLRHYKRPIQSLFHDYSTKANIRSSSEDLSLANPLMRERLISENTLYKLLRDNGVNAKMLSRDTFFKLFKEFTLKNCSKSTEYYLNIKQFETFLIHVANYIYSQSPYDNSCMPLVVSIHSLIQVFKDYSKRKFLYDEADYGTGDREMVKHLNWLLEQDVNTELPTGFKKWKDYELDVDYKVSPALGLKESQIVAIEILDEIVHSSIGVHFLMGQVKMNSYTRAIGVTFVANSGGTKGQGRLRSVSPPVKVVPNLAPYIKASPGIKAEVQKLVELYDKSILIDCGEVVEDLIYSVESGSSTLISKYPKPPGTIKNQFKAEQEWKLKAQEIEKERSNLNRQKRRQEIEINLQKAREEKERKDLLEQQEQERLSELENLKKQKEHEKWLQEQNYRKQQIEKWQKEKAEEEARQKEQDEKSQREIQEAKKKAREEFLKQEAKKLQSVLKSKKEERKQKEEEEMKLKQLSMKEQVRMKAVIK